MSGDLLRQLSERIDRLLTERRDLRLERDRLVERNRLLEEELSSILPEIDRMLAKIDEAEKGAE